MDIQRINSTEIGFKDTDSSTRGDGGFIAELEKSIGEVNSLLKESDEKSMELASGRSENLHSAMIAVEKAETALKLLVQIRNKALEAYHEVMRMNV